MAHKLNINFALYTAFDENAAQSIEAVKTMQASGIEFSHVHYFDFNQMQEVLASVQTWFTESENVGLPDAYPFVLYEQAYDITDTPARKSVLIHGLDAIKTTNWQELKNFQG
jgi:hypothetical protein